MAKSNVFLGLASGKVGDIVFARAKGQQITRVRVVPNNPRTARQQAQRVRMAAVAALYRAGRVVLKDSFTVRHGFESSYNAFARNAIGISPFFTRQMVDNCLALPIPSQASRGVLTPLVVNKSTGVSAGVDRMPSYGLELTDTVGEWSQAFLEANPTYKNGDKVTYLVIRFIENAEVPLEDAYNPIATVAEIVIDTESAQTIKDAGWGMSDIEGSKDYLYPASMSNFFSDDTLAASDNIMMTVAIGSSKGINGELLVSSEYFTLTAGAKRVYDSFRTASALEAAINSYGSTSDSTLSV